MPHGVSAYTFYIERIIAWLIYRKPVRRSYRNTTTFGERMKSFKNCSKTNQRALSSPGLAMEKPDSESYIYYHIFPERQKPVVPVLNPLDSLGEDRSAVFFFLLTETYTAQQAISLGKMVLNKELVEELRKGVYSFI
ncbi:hypothetical protein VP01_216g1 [Puccinia sorghi]|uniref:Uncharacterized protein n=1 Tax=Puccinia sorghi TaxID=27349 RepID=A0A0L6V9E3_9BASI|nr:hypothetical protein VP01_216g1 [Puccinia sorghi]